MIKGYIIPVFFILIVGCERSVQIDDTKDQVFASLFNDDSLLIILKKALPNQKIEKVVENNDTLNVFSGNRFSHPFYTDLILSKIKVLFDSLNISGNFVLALHFDHKEPNIDWSIFSEISLKDSQLLMFKSLQEFSLSRFISSDFHVYDDGINLYREKFNRNFEKMNFKEFFYDISEFPFLSNDDVDLLNFLIEIAYMNPETEDPKRLIDFGLLFENVKFDEEEKRFRILDSDEISIVDFSV